MDVDNKRRLIALSVDGLKKYELTTLEHEASRLFAPFTKEDGQLVFDVTSLVSFCDYMGRDISADRRMRVIIELERAIALTKEYLLVNENLCLDPDTIFWNESTEKIYFLYARPEDPDATDLERFRLWAVSLWHRSVSLEWDDEESLLWIHWLAVCMMHADTLEEALSEFIHRWSQRATSRQTLLEQTKESEKRMEPHSFGNFIRTLSGHLSGQNGAEGAIIKKRGAYENRRKNGKGGV